MLNQLIQRVWNPSAATGKIIPLHPALPTHSNDLLPSILTESIGLTTRMVKLTMVTAGANNKYYKMCENDDNTFTVHYGRVGGIRSTVRYPMAHWTKKLREKMAQGYGENLTIEPVLDAHVLTLIRRMMGPDAHRFEAAFSVRHPSADTAFNTYLRQQSNRKTLALWHGHAKAGGYAAICEVHVGSQWDSRRPEEFIVYHPAQCTVRYLVRINA
jgi:predicted DNA-binding WGR domain protein